MSPGRDDDAHQQDGLARAIEEAIFKFNRFADRIEHALLAEIGPSVQVTTRMNLTDVVADLRAAADGLARQLRDPHTEPVRHLARLGRWAARAALATATLASGAGGAIAVWENIHRSGAEAAVSATAVVVHCDRVDESAAERLSPQARRLRDRLQRNSLVERHAEFTMDDIARMTELPVDEARTVVAELSAWLASYDPDMRIEVTGYRVVVRVDL